MTMTSRRLGPVAAVVGLVLGVAACGGNLGGQSGAEAVENFPRGPVTMSVGQQPGGNTDLIGRALAEHVSTDLGVPVPVENKPGANGALAAKQLEGANANGQDLMVVNSTLATITPLAVPASEAVAIDDFEVVTGVSHDDYILVTGTDTRFTSIDDLATAGRTLTYATSGVGTGNQLATELLFEFAGIDGRAVPFDGNSPALTAVLGGQADVTAVTLGEAIAQVRAGALTPLAIFAPQRNAFFADVPTAVESGYDVAVQVTRAVVAPKGTPPEILDRLRASFDAAFAAEGYREFNERNLLTPHEVPGEQIVQEWSSALEQYRALTADFGIDLGGAR